MSTTEYVAVVLLVSIVLAVGGAQIAGVDIAEAVGRKIKVALCVVAGDDCDENGEEEACVVSSESKEEGYSGVVSMFQANDGRTVKVEQLSNGRYRVTVSQDTGIGAGGGVNYALKGEDSGFEADVGYGLFARAEYERVFTAATKQEAEKLVERLDDDDWKLAGAAKGFAEMFSGDHAGAQEQFLAVGVGAEAEASLSALGLDAGSVAGSRNITAGIRLHHESGDRSLVLTDELAASADINLQLGALGFSGDSPRSFALRLDRNNRPIALELQGAVEGSVAANILPQLAKGERGEVQAELSLADPVIAKHAGRLMRGDVTALGDLVRAIPSSARIKVQKYKVSSDEGGWDIGATIPRIGEISVGKTDNDVTARLTGALEHKPGTPLTAWEQDCVTVV